MNYTKEEVKQFVEEEDVKFIRLAFCDVFGKAKNISIMPAELDRAFNEGIAIDAWSIKGFEDFSSSDLFLHPDPNTLAILPWRPEHGRVVRMFCDITWQDGTPFECDSRRFLRDAVRKAEDKGYTFYFGTEQEFYLFRSDIEGDNTRVPYDEAGYMDIGPEDRGENIRREICITLEQMGISPESSHHEEGPGQNEIDFRYCDALKSADDAMTFRSVVSAVAGRNGATVDFSPKPVKNRPGNGMHINFSVRKDGKEVDLAPVIAGILKHAAEMTLFFNPTPGSYNRLGTIKAPAFITWAKENRSTLIRIPAAFGEYKRAELRSPDPMATPYLAFGLIIYAGLEGIEQGLVPPEETKINLYRAERTTLDKFETIPSSLEEAIDAASGSDMLKEVLPGELFKSYLDKNSVRS